ncbi:hypothetical protein AB6A40_010093 [Gnathostoma spinigerum]|uniref:DUF4461 domain-containing protein n=1 Tax=Gnathostoma spinigerum TaxID=75299 RepID=A0ABD6ETT6_9BILA
MSPYDELSVARDGYLLIPCNENIKHCITFLRENAEKSRDLVFSAEQLREKIRISRLHCISELRLADISWQQGMNREYLLSSIQRLAKCSDAVRNLLSGIHIHFCLNPTIYVMSDGRLSVPLDWVA